MPTRSFPEKLDDWQTLFNNITPQLANLPHLAKDHAALEPVLAEARALQDQQDVQKGQLRATNQRRDELDKLGRDLRNRLAAGLKSTFGLDSEKLVEFGLKPVARNARRPRLPKAAKAQALTAAAAKATAQAAAEAATEAAAKAAAKLVAEAAAQ